ncbi:uncharacterized protein LOC106087162 [Stomoxys calcitrans]|uniref:uncharacterized protein LOC106087162 n=1 Tax=Stomoxys calcitrans TaxID=35570 RepID=UPI0027E28EF8|nr:uncharacterized protein LOC106087162 [Stomoxys calcitrans]
MFLPTVVSVTVLCVAVIGSEKNWTYELISVESTSSDPNIADIAVSEKRIRRGLYAFSGFLDFKTDLDDTTTLDLRVYRSSTERDEDYQLTPFVIENEILTNFINFHYKAYIMAAIKDCAPTAPQYDGDYEFEPPFAKIRIDVNECGVPTDGFPNLMEYGMYKIEAYLRNDIEMFLKIIVRLEQNL